MSGGVLVPFSLAAGAMGPGVPASAAPHHERLLRLWRQVGILVVPEPEIARSSLLSAVQQLPVGVRHLWMTALTQAAKDGSLRLFSECQLQDHFPQCPCAVPAGCSKHSVVFAVDRQSCARVAGGLPSGFEATTIDEADQTRAFAAALDMSSATVERLTPTSKLWDAHVSPMFAVARKRVVIVDRYALASVLRYRDRKRTFKGSGLARLLAAVRLLSRNVQVELIFGEDKDRPGSVMAGLRAAVESTLR